MDSPVNKANARNLYKIHANAIKKEKLQKSYTFQFTRIQVLQIDIVAHYYIGH